ncbi:hypothetical protein Tco_1149488 [Tanacetum coccineum]
MFHQISLSQFVPPFQTQQFTTINSTPLSITYPSNRYQSTISPQRLFPHTSSHLSGNPPTKSLVNGNTLNFSPQTSGPSCSSVPEKGIDPIDCDHSHDVVLTVVVTSRGDKPLMLAGHNEKNTPGARWKQHGETTDCHLLQTQRGGSYLPSSVLIPREKGMKQVQ